MRLGVRLLRVLHCMKLYSDWLCKDLSQGGTGIARHDRGSVLSKVASGAELTTYVSSNISFLRMIRLDFIDNACANTPYTTTTSN